MINPPFTVSELQQIALEENVNDIGAVKFLSIHSDTKPRHLLFLAHNAERIEVRIEAVKVLAKHRETTSEYLCELACTAHSVKVGVAAVKVLAARNDSENLLREVSIYAEIPYVGLSAKKALNEFD